MIDTSGSEKTCSPVLFHFVSWSRLIVFFFARGSFVVRLHEYAKSGSVQLPECNLLKNERLEKLVSVKLTSGNHLFRNERTELKLILVAFCSESSSLFLNLDRAFFWIYRKITRKSVQRNCLFPLSVLDPPNFF